MTEGEEQRNAVDGVRLSPRGWLPGWWPGLILVFPLKQGFSASAPLTVGARHSFAGGGVLSCAL